MNARESEPECGHAPSLEMSCLAGGSTFTLTASAIGFFFSFRTITVLISARVLGVGSEPGVKTNFVFGLLALLLVVFQTVGSPALPIGNTWRLPALRWVYCFLFFSLCSLAWSATISPLASLFYWLEMALDVSTVILLLVPAGDENSFYSLMEGYIWGSAVLGLIALAMPLEADLRLGDQEFFNTNQIGNLCATALFLCQLRRARGDRRHQIIAPLLAITLFRSLSKATLTAFAVGQIYLFFRDRRTSRKKKMFSAASAGLVILLFSGLYRNYYDTYTSTGNQAETLTGRTAIWIYCFDAALQRPWVGNGIDSLWKVAPPFGNELFEARHAENEILQQFYAYGVVGVVIVAGLYWSFYRQARSMRAGPTRAVLTALLLYILVRGLAEAEPFDLLLPLWMITAFSLGIGKMRSIEDEACRQVTSATIIAGPGDVAVRGISP